MNERDRSSGNKKQPQTRNEDKTKISSNVSKNVKQVKTQVSPKSKIVQSVSSCATNYMAEIEDVSSDGISDVSEGYDVMDVEDISSDDLDLGEDDDGDGEPDFESEMMAAFAAYQDELGDGYSVVSDEEMEINDSENDACNIDTKTDKTDKDLKQKEGIFYNLCFPKCEDNFGSEGMGVGKTHFPLEGSICMDSLQSLESNITSVSNNFHHYYSLT